MQQNAVKITRIFENNTNSNTCAAASIRLMRHWCQPYKSKFNWLKCFGARGTCKLVCVALWRIITLHWCVHEWVGCGYLGQHI